MAAGTAGKFWSTDLIRDQCLAYLSEADLRSLRLVNQDFAHSVAPVLFRQIRVRFNTHTFSRSARLIALERVGQHVRSFRFIFDHSAATFLPPLIAPDTLEELNFVYEPHTITSRPASSSSSGSSSSFSSSARYGSWDIDDLLIKHYPPIFHAATNIPAFCRALRALPNVRAISISCPGQEPAHLYRRDAVDFALISLRVAIEQANPRLLEDLHLDCVHPGAAFSLRPQASFGSSPASTRVWRRIKKIQIRMDSFDCSYYAPADHLKILHTYLQAIPAVEELDFEWIGQKGPCPMSLDAEPCMCRPPSLSSVSTCEETPISSIRQPLRFRHLRKIRVRNAAMDASQAAAFVRLHRKVLDEFDFDECSLRSGTWDDALAPLYHMDKKSHLKYKASEVVEVPLMMSPVHEKAMVECIPDAMWPDQHVRSRGSHSLRHHLGRLLKRARLGWNN